jgi:hypothetical protein
VLRVKKKDVVWQIGSRPAQDRCAAPDLWLCANTIQAADPKTRLQLIRNGGPAVNRRR